MRLGGGCWQQSSRPPGSKAWEQRSGAGAAGLMEQPLSSSNGDAAASLWAAMGTAAAPDMSASDQPPSEAERQAAVPVAVDAPSTTGAPWRLKFLQRVGIQEGSRESPSSEGGGPADIWGDESETPLTAESVVVRTVAPPRTNDTIRAAYIRKLEMSKASMPQLSRPKSAQVVTIFDWDDTLLCTTHLEMVQRQYGAIPVHVRDQLAQLEKVVHQILLQAMAAGKVFIITNASEGWVQHSAGMCMPGLSEPLKQMEVISARAGFENAFPGDSHAWKMHSFLQVQNKLQMEAVTNLISVGDSHIEMDAVHLLGRSFAHALVKTVKLWERPTPYELIKQLEVVKEKLPEIYDSGTTLNIWLERESTEGAPR